MLYRMLHVTESKKISNNQELLQSDPRSRQSSASHGFVGTCILIYNEFLHIIVTEKEHNVYATFGPTTISYQAGVSMKVYFVFRVSNF